MQGSLVSLSCFTANTDLNVVMNILATILAIVAIGEIVQSAQSV